MRYENATDPEGVVWRIGWEWNKTDRFYEQKTITKVLDPGFVQDQEPWYYPLLRVCDYVAGYFGFWPEWCEVPRHPWLTNVTERPVRQESQGTEDTAAETPSP